jgi:hypothetical protein
MTSTSPSIPSVEYPSFGQFSMNYLQSNDLSYHHYHSYNIFVGSWNVNAKIEEVSNLSKYLNIDSYIGDPPDILVLGFQEIIELSATNTLVASASSGATTPSNISAERINKWQENISESLRNGSAMRGDPSPSSSYQLVESLSMVGIWCVIYAKKLMLPLIKNIQAKAIPRGAGGLLGNKGGVCISLMIHDTSCCFVCAHLTANREEVLRRNEDFHSILKKRVFLKSSFMNQIQTETAMSTFQTKVFTQILEKKEQLVTCLQELQINSSVPEGNSGSIHEIHPPLNHPPPPPPLPLSPPYPPDLSSLLHRQDVSRKPSQISSSPLE